MGGIATTSKLQGFQKYTEFTAIPCKFPRNDGGSFTHTQKICEFHRIYRVSGNPTHQIIGGDAMKAMNCRFYLAVKKEKVWQDEPCVFIAKDG